MISRHFAALAVAAMMAVLLWAGWPAQAASIMDSKHNLSATGPGTIKATTESQVCVFCHVPHNARATGPLWNRDQPAGPYAPYISTTRKIAAPGAPTGASLLCLSCHDGTIALGKISSRATPIPTSGRTNFLTGDLSYLGTDLSDDHPVSFLYSSVLTNTELRVPTGAVKLDVNGQLQCTACHSPHDNANGKFLVVNNIRSALCTNCHNKTYWAASDHATSTKTWTGAGTNPWLHTSYAPQNVVNNACENCHRPHTAQGKARLLHSATDETNCLVCHSGTVAAVGKRIDSELAKTSGHKPGNYSNVHDAAEANLMAGKHVECQDCHNPHSANGTAGSAPGTTPIVLPGSLSNVRGINISGNPKDKVTAEYEVCFRCHADSGTRGPPARTARVIVQTNTRLEFQTGNPSYHPIAGVGRSTDVPSLILPWTTSSMMTCSDCHNNNAGPNIGGAGPNGPHGSTNPLLLERMYVVADNTSESAANYALCYKCHSRTNILANAAGSFREHNKHIVGVRTPCNVCHDPHGVGSPGTPLSNSRLINFQTGVVTRSGTQAIRWERVGTTGGRCYLVCHGENHNPLSY